MTKKLRIAQVPTIDYQVPPVKYGAVHSLVYDLSKFLADQGHQVTVFADSRSQLDYPGITLAGINVELIDDQVNPYRRAEISQFLEVFRRQNEFDIVHWHYDPIALNCIIDGRDYNFLDLVQTPSLTTLHFSPQYRGNLGFYQYHRELWGKNYVSISNSQRTGVEFLNFKRTIYHGIDLNHFTPVENPTADYLLFIGRLTEEKGILDALEVAKKTGKKLKIAAKIEPQHQEFFDQQVKPLLNLPNVEFLGEVGYTEKVALYQNALATLFPIRWEEPFGLVMIESLACGTPIVAYKRGSVPEVVEDGKTGFVVENIDELCEAVDKIGLIDRGYCRNNASSRFTVDRMVREYSEVYAEILA